MRPYIFFLFVVAAIFPSSQITASYKIKFDVKHLNDSIVYLARYYGDNKYIKDTIEVNGKEEFTIQGEDDLPCGIYLIVREKRNSYFEFIVNGQEFEVITDTTDFVNKTKFKNSPENTQMYEYFKYANNLGKEIQGLQKKFEKAKKDSNDTEASELQNKISDINKEINTYKENFILNNPNNPMTVVFNMQKEVVFPDSILDDKSPQGENRRYNYYLEHYWDYTDFTSPCLLRTPVFHHKMQRFFDKYVPQHFDSAIVHIEKLISRIDEKDEVYKYVVNYVTFKWESGKEKRMCWDKVFYHMGKNYYLKGKCPWTDSVKLAKIETRVKDLRYVLCGDQAKNLEMKYYGGAKGLYDTSGVLHDLYLIDADITIMWFWDSDCGHCKKQTPKLWDLYQEYKEKETSMEVYAVNVEQESEGYKNYLKENKYTWINVQDTGNFSAFRKYYDIYSTPVAYILDKDKRIIGKRLAPEAIKEFLEEHLKEEKALKSEKE